jgi:Na+-driven multidrug efflux pump
MVVFAVAMAKPLSAVFVGYDAELEAMTIRAFMIYSLSFLLCGFNIFGSSMFTALNNGLISAVISFLRTLVFQIAAVMLLPMIWELDGIWFNFVGVNALAAVMSVICRYGRKFLKRR